MNDNPLVAVWWFDSRRPAGEWLRLDDFEPEEICCCCSVGYLVHEDDEQLALAPNIADADSDNPQISGIIQIPVSCVTKRRTLKFSVSF